jgi:hypothetical protein
MIYRRATEDAGEKRVALFWVFAEAAGIDKLSQGWMVIQTMAIGPKKDTSMNRFALTSSLAIFLFSLAGCTAGTYNPASPSQQEAVNGYCHKKVQAIGPSDVARSTQVGGGDYIDYSGPCDGPSISDRIQKQKRYEQFRFGREYMDEG